MKKIHITQAAAVLNKSPQFIRIGMQRGLLPIGTAIKMESKWSYLIIPSRFAEFLGISKQELEEMLEAVS